MAKPPLQVETLVHDKATRKNIPTAEFESLMRDEEKKPCVSPMRGATRISIRN